jgi:hypothetical protein
VVVPPEPYAEGDVDPQLLIKEARARTRRRRRRLALALAGLLVVTGGVVAVVRSPSGRVAAARRAHDGSPAVAPAVLPRFFADTQGSGEGNGPLQIRETDTGVLVWQGQRATSAGNVTGLAAVGPGSYVVATNAGGACATRLWRIRPNASGVPDARTPLGPTLPGILWSLAVGDSGRVIGYAISGCSKGASGYLGVLQVPSGRARQWGDVSLGGISSGNLALQGQLSLSANGRLLAFAADAISQPDGLITGQSVRLLATDAPPGPVAGRSRVVYRQGAPRAGAGPAPQAASLSPSGTSAYLCLQSATRARATAKIAEYGIPTGKPGGVIATFTATGTWPQVSCSSMSLDSSGRFLLVPYWVNHPTPPSDTVLQRVARIDLATKAISTMPVKLPGSGGISEQSGMAIVAW